MSIVYNDNPKTKDILTIQDILDDYIDNSTNLKYQILIYSEDSIHIRFYNYQSDLTPLLEELLRDSCAVYIGQIIPKTHISNNLLISNIQENDKLLQKILRLTEFQLACFDVRKEFIGLTMKK